MTNRRSRGRILLAGACLCLASLAPYPVAAVRLSQTRAPAGDRAITGLRAALDNYVALRTRLRDEVPPLRVTPDPSEIVQASDALARAVTRARQNDKPGAFFDAAAAAEIRRLL